MAHSSSHAHPLDTSVAGPATAPPVLRPGRTLHLAESPRRPQERHAVLAALALYSAWTLAVVGGIGDRVDPWFAAPDLDPRSGAGQAAEAFALVTHPVMIAVVIAVLAVRSLQQRQRRLALALSVAALGIPAWAGMSAVFVRERPDSAFSDSLSAVGHAFPSGHIAAATILTWVVVTLANAQRKSPRSRWKRRILGCLLVGCVGADQWALGIHHGSDLVGGLFFGVMVAAAALWLSGVEAITASWQTRVLPDEVGRRAAVIYNPTKIAELDLFRRRVAFAMARAGWASPLWLETRHDDPGHEMARSALDRGVDRVLVAGGDGTARTVCAALAGTGLPVALVPAGTGNLLGRNLGIPLDEDEALDVALDGVTTAIDMIRWTIEGASVPFVVMAGVGLDAQIMRDTSPYLKKIAKAGAYVVAGAQQIRMPAFRATVTLDGVLVYDGDAVMTLVGNVGRIQGGVALIPSASPTDGALDLLVATGSGARGLLQMITTIGRAGPDAPLRRFRGRRVDVVLDRPVAYQLDGDSEGETSAFSAEVDPGAILVMTPR